MPLPLPPPPWLLPLSSENTVSIAGVGVGCRDAAGFRCRGELGGFPRVEIRCDPESSDPTRPQDVPTLGLWAGGGAVWGSPGCSKPGVYAARITPARFLCGGAPAPAILAQPSPGTRPAWLGPQWPLGMAASKVAGGVGDRKAEKAGTSDLGRRLRSLPGSRRSPVQPALWVGPVPPGPRPGCLGVSPHLPTSPRLVSAWLSPCPWG